jgi:predicted transcriptional regulator
MSIHIVVKTTRTGKMMQEVDERNISGNFRPLIIHTMLHNVDYVLDEVIKLVPKEDKKAMARIKELEEYIVEQNHKTYSDLEMFRR